jgi:Ca2+-binding EF-hand superfamily protein
MTNSQDDHETVTEIARSHNITDKEVLKVWIQKFNALAENNKIPLKRFIEAMTAFGWADVEHAQRIFRAFDRENSGKLTVKEWIRMLAVTYGGTVDQKLHASFRLFDKNNNGDISKHEMADMLKLVLRLRARKGVPHEKIDPSSVKIEREDLVEVKSIVKQIFNKFDSDKDGTITFQEFINAYYQDPQLCGWFKQF